MQSLVNDAPGRLKMGNSCAKITVIRLFAVSRLRPSLERCNFMAANLHTRWTESETSLVPTTFSQLMIILGGGEPRRAEFYRKRSSAK